MGRVGEEGLNPRLHLLAGAGVLRSGSGHDSLKAATGGLRRGKGLYRDRVGRLATRRDPRPRLEIGGIGKVGRVLMVQLPRQKLGVL